MPTDKQHISVIKKFFEYLVTGQIVPYNPATDVTPPKQVIRKGKTPILSALDTDVVVSGLRSPTGASAALLMAGRHQKVQLLASTAMLLEYESKCIMDEHRRAAGLTKKEVEVFLNTLASFLEPIEPYFLWRPHLADPDDEMVLETAVNGQANAIVTFNKRHYKNVQKTVEKNYHRLFSHTLRSQR